MAGKTERHHPLRITVAWSAMMHCYGALTTPDRGASRHAAPITVSSKDLFSVTSEVLLVLPPQRVAGRAKAKGKDAIAGAKVLAGVGPA